jgi:hypothetical protein
MQSSLTDFACFSNCLCDFEFKFFCLKYLPSLTENTKILNLFSFTDKTPPQKYCYCITNHSGTGEVENPCDHRRHAAAANFGGDVLSF